MINQPTNFGESRIFFRGWPAGVAMVAMVATGQKSTLGAVARHPGAGVGYLGRLVGFVHDWWPPGVAARLPCPRVPVPRALGASRAPQRLHAASSRTGRGSLGLWGGSRVMATMATMATPTLNLEKKKQGGGGRGDNPPTDTQHEIFFRGWPAGGGHGGHGGHEPKSRP